MNPVKLAIIKWQFRRRRDVVYEGLESSLNSQGTKRQELISETFRRWGDREAARGKWIAHAYRSISRRLEGGKALSEALAPFIPVEEMLTIEAGEKGVTVEGKLKLSLAIESARMQKRAGDDMKKAVNGAMAEPMTQLVIFIITSIVYGKMIWPAMLEQFPDHFWPSWCLPIVYFQLWTANNWIVIGALCGLVILYYWSLPNWSGKGRQFLDRFPPYSVYRDRMASALLGVLGGLLHGGLTLEEALRRVEPRSTPYLRSHVRRMIRLLPASGKEPMKALSTGLFSLPVLDRIEDAASSREFDETLVHMGKEALGSIIETIRRAAVAAGLGIVSLVAVLFLYQTAVQVFGIQDTTDAYIASMNKSKARP